MEWTPQMHLRHRLSKVLPLQPVMKQGVEMVSKQTIAMEGRVLTLSNMNKYSGGTGLYQS